MYPLDLIYLNLKSVFIAKINTMWLIERLKVQVFYYFTYWKIVQLTSWLISCSHVIREFDGWLLVLYTSGTDVISLLLTGLDGACFSLGHQPKSCTMFEKWLASRELHTRKMSLPFSLTAVTILTALLQGLLARILYNIPADMTPSWCFSQELSGNSPSQQLSKCGLNSISIT